MFTRRTFARPMAAAAVTATPALSQNRPPLSRIAFGSCANQAMGQPIWDAVLSYRPDLFLFCGDNVYGDFNSTDAANLKRADEETGKIPGYARLRDTGHAESRCRSGTRCPPDFRDVAQRLKASATPVREVLLQLVAERVLGVGAGVRSPSLFSHAFSSSNSG